MDVLAGYNSSIFQDFGKYLGTENDLFEVGIRLVLDEYSSHFIFYEFAPCIYTFKHLSEVPSGKVQCENDGVNQLVNIEFKNITMKTNWL